MAGYTRRPPWDPFRTLGKIADGLADVSPVDLARTEEERNRAYHKLGVAFAAALAVLAVVLFAIIGFSFFSYLMGQLM